MSSVRKMHPMWWPAIIAVLFFIALLANMWGACESQWKETVSNLLIGAITSSLVVFLVAAYDRLRWYRAFVPLAGSWEEHEFCKSNGRILDTAKASGHACIRHQCENTLSIKLTHPDAESGIRIWHGQMIRMAFRVTSSQPVAQNWLIEYIPVCVQRTGIPIFHITTFTRLDSMQNVT
jgi:hypothetical protein